MKERIDYYDRAKGLLILLVVIGHVVQYANPAYNIVPYVLAQSLINSFHMSAFFVISGMLLNNEQWRAKRWGDFLQRRVVTLLIPYCFFELIAAIYESCVLRRISFVDGIYNLLTFRCNIGADWFLPAMFVAQCICFFYIKHPNQVGWTAAVILCFLCTWYMPGGHWWQVLCRGMLGFGFIFLGNTFKKMLNYEPAQKYQTYLVTGGAFFLTAACAAFCFKFGGNDFYLCVVNNPLLFVIGGLSGTYFIIGVSRMVQFKWLRWIGENSLIIMGTHQLVLYTVPSSSSTLWVVGVFVLILVIEVPVIFLTERFCPFFVGKAKLTK